MFKLSHSIFNSLRSNNRPLNVIKYNNKCLKSSVAEVKKQTNIFNGDMEEDGVKAKNRTQNSMVAAAFAALQPNNNTENVIKTPFTDDKISKAKSVDDLLSISEGNGVSRRHALKVVSTLADWSSTGRAKLADFENDTRFIKLCRILTKGTKITRNMAPKNEDLSTVLNVTADDEAARLVESLTLSQAVKVMTSLSQKKRRSVSLLRSLAYNITKSSERLNLKECADLLYAMCVLNFHDDNLIEKICGDVRTELGQPLKTSSVIGSIVTSLGLLKYKNCEILDMLGEWILKNQSICRPQDIFGFFITLATVNHTPANADQVYKVLVPQLTEAEARRPVEWLNIVWALVLLNQASSAHISSVLTDEFVDKIEANTPSKLKLLNINAAATVLLKNYSGPTLSPLSKIYDLSVVRTKEKTEMVDAVVDSLKNLIQLEDHLQTNINTNFGFFIDAYCLLDSKCNPLQISKANESRTDVNRVAILVYDYHDMCRGKVEATGVNAFACKLLECQNYKVLTIPYTEFRVTDKLIHRVQYLESRLKEKVK